MCCCVYMCSAISYQTGDIITHPMLIHHSSHGAHTIQSSTCVSVGVVVAFPYSFVPSLHSHSTHTKISHINNSPKATVHEWCTKATAALSRAHLPQHSRRRAKEKPTTTTMINQYTRNAHERDCIAAVVIPI